MNIARWFAYTRKVETDLIRALHKIAALEAALEERTSYAFSLCGRPTPEQMKERTATGKLKPDIAPLPPRASLRNVRRDLTQTAMGEIMKKAGAIDESNDSMKARADEFVKKANGHAG